MGVADFLKDFGAPIAWAVATCGWFMANRHANAREKRKEFRSEIDAIEKLVKELTAKLTVYFTAVNRDESARILEMEINALFQDLYSKSERIARRRTAGPTDTYFQACKQTREDFFMCATGKYFETGERIPADLLRSHINEIHVRALSVTEAFHRLFLKKFDGI